MVAIHPTIAVYPSGGCSKGDLGMDIVPVEKMKLCKISARFEKTSVKTYLGRSENGNQ